jgi:putative ABC transport system permease protein
LLLQFPTDTEIWDMLRRALISIILLMIIVAFSIWQKIKMEKTFIISFLRGFIQLLIMASILIFIFSLEDLWILSLVLIFMCFFAAYTAKNQFNYPNMFRFEFVAITIGSLTVMAIVLFTGIIPKNGEYIIPMGGMVIANVMVMTTIVLERMIADIKKSKGLIEAALSLGDTPRNSLRLTIQESLKAGLIPTTNRVAILGIVTIPGLMSGMIIGGVNPIVAAVYQIIIFAMILSGGFIGQLIISYLFLTEIFTSDYQLNLSLFN